LKSTPIVTVIIPTYNYGQYIHEAIDSILTSSFPQNEIEIIVIDDGSTDDTFEVGQSYGKCVHYLFQHNQGKALATKVGINQAKGRYIFNLDADDYFLPGKIERVVNIFESDKEVVHVGHPALCWDTSTGTKQSEVLPDWLGGRKINGKEVLLDFYKKRILFGGGSTFAARTEILKQCSIPKEVDMYIDEYLALMTLNRGCSYFIDEPLSVWRIHGENYSDLDDKGKYSETALNKAERNMSSLNAVLSLVLNEDFSPDIKMLYSLKVKVAQIAIKEQAGQKSYADVVDLWKHLLATFRTFGKESFGIMRNYTVLNRTLPTPILQLAKRAIESTSIHVPA
jgi:glycosyltransferase involved in cell wall biosynthesis